MASRPPMSMWISDSVYEKEHYCYLDDFQGRKFKTLLPSCVGRRYVGLTCGYLVMLSLKTHDYWLVNPITRHELYFPPIPYISNLIPFRAILVFSPSVSWWLFVLLERFSCIIWFSTVGKGAWNYVSSAFSIIDLHVFHGKIYALNNDWQLCEMRLSLDPKLTLLEIKNSPKELFSVSMLVSSDENLYLMGHSLKDPIQELDFGKMKWVPPKEKTIREYAFFHGDAYMMCWTAIKLESWVVPRPQYNIYDCFVEKYQKGRFFSSRMWYFPHDCLDINLIN
ncbi:unnamed protein product [Lactuca virosa]|uniref:KIB1-4 beta-propeller domain-containing protein n=1 Tax=Lactuca virosa TaxID=75947 RepID=A0AAU9LRQ4_9ASTR|nr:unnamed protein product [Lactuca virosa]